MFIFITLAIFVVSFILALRSLRTINEKPGMSDVKKSLDKNKIIFQGHSSSE